LNAVSHFSNSHAHKITKIKEMAAAANTNTTTIVSPSSIKALQNSINDDESYIDLKIMAEGLKFMQKIIAQPALRYDAGVRPIAPGAQFQSDDEIREYARQAYFTSYHPVGTSASMFPHEEGGVVDLPIYASYAECSFHSFFEKTA
jgi:choline dehydrogenase-like flavoprotein